MVMLKVYKYYLLYYNTFGNRGDCERDYFKWNKRL